MRKEYLKCLGNDSKDEGASEGIEEVQMMQGEGKGGEGGGRDGGGEEIKERVDGR